MWELPDANAQGRWAMPVCIRKGFRENSCPAIEPPLCKSAVQSSRVSMRALAKYIHDSVEPETPTLCGDESDESIVANRYPAAERTRPIQRYVTWCAWPA